jgi:4-aminobutyrate aminotransferase-like enzyme
MNCLTNNPVLGHINTFGGNAVCLAAAQASLEIITNEKLFLRANEIETIILNELKHPLIKEIRIKGALCAIDFGNEDLNFKIIKACLQNGIITDWFLFCTTAMRLSPPLVISNEELKNGITKIIEIINKN